MIEVVLILFLTFLFNTCDKSKSDWEMARQLNTIEGYNEFLSKHSQSKFAEVAKEKIEELTWDSTVKDNTIEAYQEFLSEYPQSKFVETAKEKIAEFRRLEELDWQKAKKQNTVEAFRDFIKKHPACNRLPSFTSSIKEVFVSALNPSDVSIKLVDYPKVVFQTNLWDAVKYGLVEKEPLEGGFPFFSKYQLKNTKGWRVMLICKKRGGNDYYVITLRKL